MKNAESDVTAKPKRRWYQFSLRAMLVVLTFLCFPLGWLAYERNVVRRRDAAVAASKTLGGRLEFDPSEHSRPAWLRPLLGDDAAGEAVSASFTGTKVTDEDLAYVARLKRLKVLYLCDTQVTDAGLAHLSGLTKLEELVLRQTQVTDAGLVHLAGLPKLERLYLNRTNVRDAGLKHLSKLTELRTLDLADTQVTDAGLAHLTGLTELRFVWLDRTGVTDVGFGELRKTLPKFQLAR